MLNKTLKDSLAKIASAPSKYLCLVGVVLLIATILVNPLSRQSIECAYYHTPLNSAVYVRDKSLVVQKVTSIADMEKGLGGRPCIKDNQAMLFVFNQSDQSNHCFWMKDMRFGIDIVWLDSNKRVIDVARDVQPQTYPKSFCPNRPTSYVLETKASISNKLGLEVGNLITF